MIKTFARRLTVFPYTVLALLLPLTAHAQSTDGLKGLAQHWGDQAGGMGAFLGPLGFFLALLFGMIGIVKILGHVKNPQQTRLVEPLVYLGVAAALSVLPMTLGIGIDTLFESGGTTLNSNSNLTTIR